jgi:hypothetical protein
VEARQGKGEGGLARACLQMSGEVGEGIMVSRGARRGVQGFLAAGNGLGLGCTSTEMIGGMGRCFWRGVVSLVQWCDHQVRARAVPMARRTFSVVVQHFRDTARRFRRASMLGEGGTSLGLRCRAR